jgi:competence protein ComEA
LLVALALFVPALPPPAASPTPCPYPGSHAERALVEVYCAAGFPGLAALEGPARLLFGLPLDANRAAGASLEALPGIGPVRAAAWLRERGRSPFCSFSDLGRVPGVGPRTLERLAGLVSVTPEAACRGRLGSRVRGGGSFPRESP